MIITKLSGGLGNQLFQYALGQNIALKQNTQLKLDVSFFENDTLRSYMLKNFNITAQVATTDEIKKISEHHWSKMTLATKRIIRLFWGKNISHIRERDTFCFDEQIFGYSGDLYLEGYWQTERYFYDIEKVVRDEFKVATPLIGKNADLIEAISKVNSISLHVRRGDYVTNESARSILGQLDIEYYYKCMEYINSRINNPHYFIFSDDPDWVFNNLSTFHPVTFIDNNSVEECYEDLRLMMSCKHHIIANSSFSWWGAWLNPNQDKIVLAPKNWHADKSRKTLDLLPTSWITI